MEGGTDLAARGSPPTVTILAFQPECNPPARTTVASRTPATANASPRPPCTRRRAARQYSRRAGEHDGADPAELDAHSEHFSPPPLYKTEGGLTTQWASPPAW